MCYDDGTEFMYCSTSFLTENSIFIPIHTIFETCCKFKCFQRIYIFLNAIENLKKKYIIDGVEVSHLILIVIWMRLPCRRTNCTNVTKRFTMFISNTTIQRNPLEIGYIHFFKNVIRSDFFLACKQTCSFVYFSHAYNWTFHIKLWIKWWKWKIVSNYENDDMMIVKCISMMHGNGI